MSIAQTIYGLFGKKLLQNTAGFTVVRGGSTSGPWISDGESLALVPDGTREVQFPMDIMGSDSISALVQLSVVFTYTKEAHKHFNFAYNVDSSSHTGDFADATKKAIVNVISPKVAESLRVKTIADMVKEITFSFGDSACEGITFKSIMLAVKPKDAAVLAALGAAKSEELLRSANEARHTTREQAIDQSALLRTKEYQEALAAAQEEEKLIAEQAKNKLAEAESTAAAQAKLAEQHASSAAAMVGAFNNDPASYALWQIANSGGDVTITTELLAAIRGSK